MDSNTNSGMKRPTNCAMNQPSSKLPQIASTSNALGAAIHVDGNGRVNINNINVRHQQQPTPEQAPRGIEFQVADPVDTFRGREQTFHEVKHAFHQQKDKQPCNLVAVCGYGGMGKTQLARMYIKRNRPTLHNVVWIFAETHTTLMESFKQLRNKLTDKGYRCYSDQDVYEYLNSKFTIFVFDNAENIRSVQEFLPAKQNNSLFLVTSKSKNWYAFHTVELKLLDLTDAEDILKAVLVHKQNIEISDSQLKVLVRKFEYETIPLLLQIRAGYVCRQILSLTKRGKQYNIEHIVKDLNNQHDLITKKFHDFILDPYDKSVFSAISQTLEQLWNEDDEASKTAARMLGISVYLNPDYIDEEIVKDLLKIKNENILNDSLDILDQYSIFQLSENIIEIHRTVQKCVQYHHREIIKSNEFYQLTLPALINDSYKYRLLSATIFKHGETNFEALCTFYERNKSNIFHRNLAFHGSIKILQLFLYKTNLIRNPNFVCAAVESDRNDIIQLLRNCGADFNVKDDRGFNALFYALKSNDYIYSLKFESIFKHGRMNFESYERNKSNIFLRNLAFYISFKILQLFLYKTYLNRNPNILCEAVAINRNDIQMLRNCGANFNIKDDQESNAIFHVCQLLGINVNTNFERISWGTIKALIESGADVNSQNFEGDMVIHSLCNMGKRSAEEDNEISQLCALMIQVGANPGIKNNAGQTAADLAREHGLSQTFQLLNATISGYRCMLHIAARNNDFKLLEWLVSHGDYHGNEVDDTGSTVLHVLAGLNQRDTENEQILLYETANHLRDRNWNVSIVNNAGDTPADVARRCGREMMVDLFNAWV